MSAFSGVKEQLANEFGPGIIINAEEGKHCGTVVLMHGLGDSADGLADLGDMLSRALPHIKFILPTALSRPVTLNMGANMTAWYDLVGLDDRASESCDGIDESVNRVRSILEEEHNSTGLPYARMALAGFSQGGAMALFTGLQMPEAGQKLAGLFVMSGYLPGKSKFKLTEGLGSIPVLHCHGATDPVVKMEWAHMTKDGLKKNGVTNYELRTFNAVGHTITLEIIANGENFLKEILPYDIAYRVKMPNPKEMSVKELKTRIRTSGLGSKAAGMSEKHELIELLEEYYKNKWATE